MLTGGCLCTAVSIRVDGALEHAPEACHCEQCRKQTGGFLMAVNVHKSRLVVFGQEQITWYWSSKNVKRGFCCVCGSTLFWWPEIPDYQWVGVSVALFDQPIQSRLSRHTFVSEQGDYYAIADGLPIHHRH